MYHGFLGVKREALVIVIVSIAYITVVILIKNAFILIYYREFSVN